VVSGGAGLPAGSGGGSGGGGGGGAVTIASGAVASGAYSAGSFAAGAGVDGWNLTEGTKADAAWTSGSGSIVALLKAVAGYESTIATNTGAAIPAGSNNIGGVEVIDAAGTNKLAIDSSGRVTLVPNQSVNTAQVNGVTTLTGAGATGTGSQRNTVAQDQTTIAGATPGRTYNTIAASQTAQALTGGSGGATGDYLSHCVIIPATTAAGAVTIYDNSTAVYSYQGGGTTALLSLIPFTIPVGAVSVSGAWKVTTGANVSVVCTGKFT